MARFQDVTVLQADLNGQRFHWGPRSDVTIRLLGRHQIHNAVMALETVEVLQRKRWNISEPAVQAGLAAAQWPARLEVLSRTPLFLLDGAHNPQCAQALADSIRTLFHGEKVVFLAGVLRDKDYPQIMKRLLPLGQAFFCLTPCSDRALSAGALADYLARQGANATACPDVVSGISAAISAAGDGGAVVVFGSLYLAGAVREAFYAHSHQVAAVEVPPLGPHLQRSLSG